MVSLTMLCDKAASEEISPPRVELKAHMERKRNKE